MKRAVLQKDKRPESILMTTDTVGGVWNYSLELALGLSRLGIKVALAAMGGRPTRAARSEARRVPGLELYESTYKLEWMPDAWRDVDAASNWLIQLATRLNPDVVHLNNFVHGDLPWDSPVLIVGHSCVASWWSAVKKSPLPSEWDEYKRRVRAGIEGADIVVAPTRSMLMSLENNYGPLPKNMVIPHGRSIGITGPAPRKEPMIFASGRLGDEARNIMMLDQVAAKVAWPIYVAGDTDTSESEAAKPSRLMTLGRLHTRTMSGWLSRASIFVHPARYEPFGHSALEAAYAGCALVLADIPSLREVWEDAAVFVDPNDASAIQRALSSLITNDRARKDLSARATERAQMFAGCRMLASYRKLYGEMLSDTKPAVVPTNRPMVAASGGTSSVVTD